MNWSTRTRRTYTHGDSARTKQGQSRQPLSRRSTLPLPENRGHTIASRPHGCSRCPPAKRSAPDRRTQKPPRSRPQPRRADDRVRGQASVTCPRLRSTPTSPRRSRRSRRTHEEKRSQGDVWSSRLSGVAARVRLQLASSAPALAGPVPIGDGVPAGARQAPGAACPLGLIELASRARMRSGFAPSYSASASVVRASPLVSSCSVLSVVASVCRRGVVRLGFAVVREGKARVACQCLSCRLERRRRSAPSSSGGRGWIGSAGRLRHVDPGWPSSLTGDVQAWSGPRIRMTPSRGAIRTRQAGCLRRQRV